MHSQRIQMLNDVYIDYICCLILHLIYQESIYRILSHPRQNSDIYDLKMIFQASVKFEEFRSLFTGLAFDTDCKERIFCFKHIPAQKKKLE